MNDNIGEKQERWLANDSGIHKQFEREVLADSKLSDEIYAALELEDALAEAAAGAQSSLLPIRRTWAVGLLAAMLAFVLLMPQLQEPGADLPPRLRGAGDTGSAIGIEPLGELSHFPRFFRWHPAHPDQKSRYRWELYDDQSRRRDIAVVADTILARDAGMTPADSVGTWLWLIIELKPDGHEGPTSAANQFTVKAKRRE